MKYLFLGISAICIMCSDAFSQDQTPEIVFARDAASGGLYEVAAGKLAESKATNPKVKEFAKKMVTDHSKANAELKALAAKKNITLPDSMDAEKQQVLMKLGQAKGTAFDKEYMSEMAKAHDIDVAKFESAVKSLSDSDLKAWASKTLPTLKMHQKHVHTVESHK